LALSRVAVYLEVSKPKVASLLIFSGAISGITAWKMGFSRSSSLLTLEAFTLTLIALTLGVLGANAITCYIDRDIDALMERTRRRPIPSGRITPPEKALYYGLVLSISALAILVAVNIYSGLWFAFGLVDSTFIYNFLTKRKTPWNIILGSPAGGAPVMVGWTAVTGQPFHIIPLLLAALIVIWTPIHIWSLAIRYSDDYRSAGVPMLPVRVSFTTVSRCIASTTLLLPVFSTLLSLAGNFQPLFYFVVQGLNTIIIILGFTLVAKPSHKNAWILFKFTSPYLAVLLMTSAIFAG